jgi:hypothetical protein
MFCAQEAVDMTLCSGVKHAAQQIAKMLLVACWHNMAPRNSIGSRDK